MSGSLDTSVLVQLVTAQTPSLAADAVRLVNGAKGRLAVADAAVIELIFVLEKVKNLKRQDIEAVIDALSGQSNLEFNSALFTRVLAIYTKHPALSIQDCYLAVLAESNESEPLWTFDKKLATQIKSTRLAGVANR